MRRVGVVTCARSDLGIYLPVLEAIREHPELVPDVIATGMHLSPEFGLTVHEIEEAGFEIFARVENLLSADTPSGVAKSMGLGVSGFAQLFTSYRPDVLLVLGDRFDMIPAALAALPFRIPVAHLHGGEVTEGAIDESLRHCITKLSHIHFTTHPDHARRVTQLGEEPHRVHVTGAPGLDRIRLMPPCDTGAVQKRFGLSRATELLLVTVHPETLAEHDPNTQIAAVLQALSRVDATQIFTAPNADPAGRVIARRIKEYCAEHHNAHLVINAGQDGYLELMAAATVMIGNSSSGIIEAASFELPVVNVGDRQRGRLRGRNVIDAPFVPDAISKALQTALSPEFRHGLVGLPNPYGDGRAAERIVETLARCDLGQACITKSFHDVEKARTP